MKFKVSHLNSLKTRIAVATLSIFLAGIWAVSIFACEALRRDMERLLGDQQLSTVAILAAQINDELGNRLAALEEAARLSSEPARQGTSAPRSPISRARPGGLASTTSTASTSPGRWAKACR